MAKILLITTGGTIACPNTDKARTPENAQSAFLECISDIKCAVDIIEPFCLDSTNITPGHILQIAKIIRESCGNYDGFVITHGTDTLAYTAAVLSCLVENSRKPIVLTGSMKPFSADNSDAPNNLRNAFLFALNKNAHGVSVVFGRFAYDATHVSKIHTTAINAFESVNFPPLASFERERIVFTEPKAEYSGNVRFHERLDERVEVFFLVPKTLPPVIRQDTRAVIILGFGTGGLPEYLNGFFSDIISRGIYVIMSTQVLRGGSNLSLYEVGSRITRLPVIDAGKMTVEYTLAKAMVSLSEADSFEQFKMLFLS